MLRTLIRDALASEAPVADLTVCGWIRTRRDAKDVIFLEINDGSCLTNLQCVVAPVLPSVKNSAVTARRLALCERQSCRLSRKGAALGTARENAAYPRTCGSRDLPAPEETPFRRVSAQHRPPPRAHQQVLLRLPRARPRGCRCPRLFPQERLLLGAHSHSHGFRLRGCGRDVPRDHDFSRGEGSFKGLFRPSVQPDCFRPA